MPPLAVQEHIETSFELALFRILLEWQRAEAVRRDDAHYQQVAGWTDSQWATDEAGKHDRDGVGALFKNPYALEDEDESSAPDIDVVDEKQFDELRKTLWIEANACRADDLPPDDH